MIKLFQFPSCWNLPNASPFCMKLETYLRMAKIPYQNIYIANPAKGPKGKLPFIEDNGQRIADSGLVIDYLKKTYHDTDKYLTLIQKSQGVVIQRTLEEHLYWVIVFSRWCDPINWPATKNEFFRGLPAPIKWFLPNKINKKMKDVLYAQGLGRHSAVDIYQLGISDLMALSTLLGNQLFILGNEPTSIDASCYAFLANILFTPISSPLQEFAKSQMNFIDYCHRMKERFYMGKD